MKYDHAVKLARSGKYVRRPHWHFVYLTSRPDARGSDQRILIFVDKGGIERPSARADRLSKRDMNADDWELADGS